MDEYRLTSPLPPPSRMQLDEKPVYSLDRHDLGIRTARNHEHQGDQCWRELSIGIDISQSQGHDQIYGYIAMSPASERIQSAVVQFQDQLARCSTRPLEHNAALIDFLHNILWIATDQFETCLDKNATYLWRLVHFIQRIGEHTLTLPRHKDSQTDSSLHNLGTQKSSTKCHSAWLDWLEDFSHS